MAEFIPDPTLSDYDDLIEQLGSDLAGRYAAVEVVLVEAAARRMRRILALEQAGEDAEAVDRQRALHDAEVERAAALAELRRVAVEQVAKIRAEGIAQQIVGVAAQASQAAVAAHLAGARNLRRGPVPVTSVTAVAALTVDLESKLDVLNQRITRFPDDVYKQTMSQYSPRVLLGAQTTRQAQAAAVQDFLSQGIGHIDYLRKDGSVHLRMPIGSYAEMVGRTSAQRAWEQAGIERMQQSGIQLGTITGGVDPCAKCAPWIGAVVSFNGATGNVTVPHATEDRMVTVEVKGTVDDARAAGWGHPNCRDRVVAYSPGLTPTQDPVEFDPAAEKERAEQRRLEREIRAAKRDAAAAMNDVDRKRAEREVREGQASMREFIGRTGRHRRSDREQLAFADGRGGTPAAQSPRHPRAPRTGIDIRIGASTRLGKEVRTARSAIGTVHTIPATLPHLPVESARLRAGENGVYLGSQSLLRMSTRGASPRLTFAHEVGHYLDHRLLGTTDRNLESRLLTEETTRAWFDVVQKTEAYAQLHRLHSGGALPTEIAQHVDYLLMPAELWGRSYAQWIALRSADGVMSGEIAGYRGSADAWTANRQWGTTDFEPVAAALDEIFRQKGLLK